MRTSDETIRELERLNAERTQGEWRAEPTPKDEDGWSSCCGIAGVGGGKSGMIYATPPGGSFPASDKKVIIAAVNALPNLLADIRDLAATEREREELRAENERLREASKPESRKLLAHELASDLERAIDAAISEHNDGVGGSHKERAQTCQVLYDGILKRLDDALGNTQEGQ